MRRVVTLNGRSGALNAEDQSTEHVTWKQKW